VVLRVLVGTYMEMYLFMLCYCYIGKPEPLPCHFSYPLELVQLKLHTVGDMDISHSLGVQCMGPTTTTTPMGGTTEGDIAALTDACG
jgi:hypothetical protein